MVLTISHWRLFATGAVFSSYNQIYALRDNLFWLLEYNIFWARPHQGLFLALSYNVDTLTDLRSGPVCRVLYIDADPQMKYVFVIK